MDHDLLTEICQRINGRQEIALDLCYLTPEEFAAVESFAKARGLGLVPWRQVGVFGLVNPVPIGQITLDFVAGYPTTYDMHDTAWGVQLFYPGEGAWESRWSAIQQRHHLAKGDPIAAAMVAAGWWVE